MYRRIDFLQQQISTFLDILPVSITCPTPDIFREGYSSFALITTLTEASCTKGRDNLFIPLAAMMFAESEFAGTLLIASGIEATPGKFSLNSKRHISRIVEKTQAAVIKIPAAKPLKCRYLELLCYSIYEFRILP